MEPINNECAKHREFEASCLVCRLQRTRDKVEALKSENARLREALELIAAPKRPDGTYNRDREACEQIARDALWPKGEK